ncbi:MAG: hypothetical protein LBP59_01040, partial [Planctomycetaceae bacterium]|nr:hypothetical protein [Planctomycetaceae bacterium]
KAIMTLFKEPVVPDWKTPEELGKMEMHEQAEYQNEKAIKSAALPRIIPPNLTAPKTSTLTKEIIKGQQNEWNVNIGSRE